MDARRKRVVDRFVDVCQQDPRIVAAFLYGSHATGAADVHSDLDLGLITTDQSHNQFVSDRADFARQLGDPVFIEDFGLSATLFVILADGTEVEITIGRENDFVHMAPGPVRVLVDKHAIISGVALRESPIDLNAQRENLRRLIMWFWHDVSHFTTAVARGHLWWAYGQLEALRRYCVCLARLRHDFAASDGGSEPYFKVQLDLPPEQLAPLEPTVVALHMPAILDAGRTLIHFYQTIAPQLSNEHGLTYPAALERLMLDRLEHVTPG